ncbi:LysM peptidoglycan-binding domain-containing protein [Desulfovibrio ferrophilus]|uniref:Peptidoglycan-binding lysin domain protein n=1 Tax=Desulfovibrio ferrophilus TaxID=241368 RepID=A0A2Z6B3A7_9BACT|nr:alkyl sulfatase dimerization domain-containing protein [Desulfovibrio ferrophilus]BBD09987.1 peptidoglycan-binding lysin domain protein [Desulfovibrio ferrophilus]
MKAVIFTLIMTLAALLSMPMQADADLVDEVKAIATLEQDDPFELIAPLVLEKAKAAQAEGDLLAALELYRLAVTINRGDRESLRLAREIKKDLNAKAKAQFDRGQAKFEAGNKDGARAELLASLHLDPDNTMALPYLKDGYNPPVLQDYTVEEGDTLRRIAEKIYGNPGGELLLTRINNLSIVDTLNPGDILKTPVLNKKLTRRLHAAASPKKKDQIGKNGSTIVVAIQEPAASSMYEEDLGMAEAGSADALLVMAKLQFGNGLYETAVSMTDEILSANPDNADAREVRNESYYRLASKLWTEGSASEAMRSLIRLPKGYKDSGKLRKHVEGKLAADSEPLYLSGVKHFLNEDLEKAVEQWELTLQVNPFHGKARTDLEKARKLLEAVRGL